MDNIDDVTRLPDDFDGRVRLFPLPELVLFPHAVQPLHIFEPRYCEMLHESLASDELIAMTTLTGAMPLPDEPPPIATTVCIGKIISHVQLEDERHNILLVGVRRAKIVRELDVARPFRIAEVDAKEDVYPPTVSDERLRLKELLLQAFGDALPAGQQVQESLQELLSGSLKLGPVTDIISYTLPFSIEHKLKLLAEANVDLRAHRLIEMLQSQTLSFDHLLDQSGPDAWDSGLGPRRGDFPPPFSVN